LSKYSVLFLILLLVSPSAFAISRTCTRLLDPPRISQSLRLCADNYYPQGISITADNIVLDCGTGVLKGNFKTNGIIIENRKNVTLKNCQIANYEAGILIKKSSGITILNANLIRNIIGVKLIESTGIIVENSFDISITRPVQLLSSAGNVFHYNNKRLEGDQCRLNQCNQPSGIARHDHILAKAEEPKKSLRRMLNDSIRAWLA